MNYCQICNYKLYDRALEKGFCPAHNNVPRLAQLVLENQIHWAIRVRYLAELHRLCRINNSQWILKDTADFLCLSPSYVGKLLKLAMFHMAVPQLSHIDSWENAYKLILSSGQNEMRLKEVLVEAIRHGKREANIAT